MLFRDWIEYHYGFQNAMYIIFHMLHGDHLPSHKSGQGARHLSADC